MKYAAILFTIFILLIIMLADAGRLGPLHVVYDFKYGDKAGHFILFGVLSLLINLTFLRSRPNDKRFILTVNLILYLLIGIEELSQYFFPNRTLDIWDLLCSWAGVSVFAWIANRNRR